jgi:4-hydroxy-2-oxoheptanedioate aldolase
VRASRLREIWAGGGVAINGWLAIPSSFSAEVMAAQQFDSLTIDMQHGVIGYQVAVTMLQAITPRSVVPLVRVPWNDPAVIMKVLDAGAYGIICPMVNTAEDVLQLVQACRYPPEGIRSWGPARASLYAESDYRSEADANIVVMPMIETSASIENLDEILSVAGIDGVYVGPADLALSLGARPALDQTDPRVVEVQLEIARACKRHSVIAGIACASAAYAGQMIAAGYRFVTIGSDSRFLAAKASGELAQLAGAGDDRVVLPAY